MFIPPTSDVPKVLKYLELIVGVLLTCSFFLYALIKGIYTSLKINENEEIKGLSPSFLNSSWEIDLSDNQMDSMQKNLILLIVVAFAFIFIRKMIFLYKSEIRIRIVYYLIFGLGFITYLHGLGVILLLVIITINYTFCILLGHRK